MDFLALQVPWLPVRLQAMHAPVQAVLQQVPSTQLPLVHSGEVMQVWPLAFLGVHFPALQKLVPVQGAVSEQPPAQMAPAHELGAQLTVSTAGHAPLPSQPAATVATPFAQLPARQD